MAIVAEHCARIAYLLHASIKGSFDALQAPPRRRMSAVNPLKCGGLITFLGGIAIITKYPPNWEFTAYIFYNFYVISAKIYILQKDL